MIEKVAAPAAAKSPAIKLARRVFPEEIALVAKAAEATKISGDSQANVVYPSKLFSVTASSLGDIETTNHS